MTVRAQFCKIDGRVLRGTQSGVLVQVLFWAAACGVCFVEMPVTVRAHFCKTDGPGARGHAVWQVLLWFGVVLVTLRVLRD